MSLSLGFNYSTEKQQSIQSYPVDDAREDARQVFIRNSEVEIGSSQFLLGDQRQRKQTIMKIRKDARRLMILYRADQQVLP